MAPSGNTLVPLRSKAGIEFYLVTVASPNERPIAIPAPEEWERFNSVNDLKERKERALTGTPGEHEVSKQPEGPLKQEHHAVFTM